MIAVCYERQEFIHPQKLGDGLSMHDVQTGQGGFMSTLTYLLSTWWMGKRVSILSGDSEEEGTFKDVSLDALEVALQAGDGRTLSRVSQALEWQVSIAKIALCGESLNDPDLVRYRAIFGEGWGKHG